MIWHCACAGLVLDKLWKQRFEVRQLSKLWRPANRSTFTTIGYLTPIGPQAFAQFAARVVARPSAPPLVADLGSTRPSVDKIFSPATPNRRSDLSPETKRRIRSRIRRFQRANPDIQGILEGTTLVKRINDSPVEAQKAHNQDQQQPDSGSVISV